MPVFFKKIFAASFLGLSIMLGGAASPPKGTDIYLADLQIMDDKLTASNPVNITNREGYDNQPAFFPDGSAIFYSSVRENEQADVFKYDLENGTTTRITNTPESEFSPTVMPGGKTFSAVRVEKDQMQRLWKFNLDGSNPQLILPDIIPVGYHCWANADTLAMFILGEHNSLQTYNLKSGRLDIIEGDIGRSLHKIPDKNAVSYVHKFADKRLLVNRLDLDTNQITPLIQVLDNNEDITWTPDGTLIMGHGSKLFKWKPGTDKTWYQFADFSKDGIKEILRLAVSPKSNKIAFVSNI
jgi:hypothetical protein